MDPTPTTQLAYPIPHCDGEGSLHVFGNQDASHLVMMCAGFPDDHRAFSPFAKRLATTEGCLVGVACLPGYDGDVTSHPKDGYSFADHAVCLREAVKALRSHSTKSVDETQLTAIFHDWGVVPGFKYTNEVLADNSKDLIPDQLVIFDVLLGMHPKTPNKPQLIEQPSKFSEVRKAVITMAYQCSYAITFLLQRYVSKYLAALHCMVMHLILKLFHCLPFSSGDFKYYAELFPMPSASLFRLAYMSYPYLHLWHAIFSGKVKSVLTNCFLPLDLKQTPVLFLYGADKPIFFHDEKVLALLNREQQQGNRSQVVKVKNAGHWLYRQQEDQCFQEVAKYLKS
jgi:pimeloyl-ACP methyl ester carboxylesterase